MNQKPWRNNIAGLLYGGAVGDALSIPAIGRKKGDFIWIDQYLQSADAILNPGDWTINTEFHLTSAESLINKQGFDAEDLMDSYLVLLKERVAGKYGELYGIGSQTYQALKAYELYKTTQIGIPPWEVEQSGENVDGSGALLRSAIVAVWYHDTMQDAIDYAEKMTKTTHYTPLCIAAAKWYVGILRGALHGESKEKLLSHAYFPVDAYLDGLKQVGALDSVLAGKYKEKFDSDLDTSGFVVSVLERALWAFYYGEDFKSGMEMVINLGGEANSSAMVYGYLAGAYYGWENIPQQWRDGLLKRNILEDIVDRIMQK